MSKEHKRLPSGKALVAPTIFPIMMFVLIEKYFSVGGVIYAHGVMSTLIFFIALAGIGVLVAGVAYVVFIITFGIRLI
ncbi:hypothetical protein ACO0K2_13805 [Undibacterium sp. MH2W]|uniref:hypothetical protein n=1 Tax=Undibacterium sp. MH2W TaxID=3413044 RepID=UPI003BEFFEB3